jgi:peptidoglycan-associated lipoprotein
MNHKNSRMRTKYSSIFGIFLFAIAAIVSSCKVKFEEPKKLFDQGYYRQSAVLFEEFSKSTKDKKLKEEAIFYAAEAYRLSDEYDKAARLYDKVLKKDPKNTKALLMRANMLKKMELYREALDAYDMYLAEVPGDTMAEYRKQGCELALMWTPDSSQYEVENFKVANTKSNDWAPMIAGKKDDVLFFVSDREGGNSKRLYEGTMETWTDIWSVEKSGKKGKEKWGKPLYKDKTDKISTKANDGPMTFDSRYSTMYVTQCGHRDKDKSTKCAIYELKKVGPEWVMGDALDFCKEDTAHTYGHPALSPDGKTLYFSSNREGGLGGFDIWAVNYSKRSKSWGNPINLGPDINTKGNEYYPYFNKHDNKLYFSSDGWPSLGGLDINNAEPTDEIGVWRERENLREPINSGGDDFGITFMEGDATKGFFSSNRGDRKNNDDIYSFDITPIIITIRGTITDCNTKKPLAGATVVLSNDRDTTKMILKTDEQGVYTAKLREKTNYEIFAKYPEKYYFEAEPESRTTYGIRLTTELVQDFCLENPLEKVITLPIFYDLDKAFIRPDAARILDTFAQTVLMRYPKLIVELGSHTDCRSSYDYNVKLAQRRADSARTYLMKTWKIDSARIVARGYGETQLINDCKCEGGKVTGFTPFIQNKTKKMVVEKDAVGNVTRSYYERYKPSEIKFINDTAYVPCDEFQHQQNRRTTVRFGFEGQISRAIVNQDVDINNTNIGKQEKDSAEAAKKAVEAPAAGSGLDISYAVRAKLGNNAGKPTINLMVLDKEPTAFAFDYNGKYTAIPLEVAASWFKSKLISKKDFLEGEKLKVGKVKLPSNKFMITKLELNGFVINNVTFQITDKVDQPTLGKSFFKVFKTESYITDSEYILIPKKAPKKPKPVRAPKPTPGKKPAEGDTAEGAEVPAPADGSSAPAEEKKK